MIDPRSSLEEIKAKRPFWVEFSNPENPDEKLSFEVTPSIRNQRKIIDRHTHIYSQGQTDKERGLEISPDWMSMAIDLSDYFCGWDGFEGEFDKQVAKDWIKEFSKYAIAFAQNFKGILDQYEDSMTKRKDIEAKN